MSLSNLPSEILLEIFDYVHIKDIIKIKSLSKVLRTKVTSIESFIVTNELKKQCVYQYAPVQKRIAHKHLELTISNTLAFTNTNFISFQNICFDSYFNALVKEYHKNKTLQCNNITNLIVIRNILQIIDNTKQDNYLIDFIYNNVSLSLKSIVIEYYTTLLSGARTINFNNLFKISKHAVTLKSMNKLYGYKCLDLSSAIFINCCESCQFDYLKNFVQLRYNLQNDNLICHNYNEIKNLLQHNATKLYNQMTIFEDRILESQLSIICPTMNKKIRYKSRHFNTLMLTMFDKYNKTVIRKRMNKQKQRLRHQIFS